MKRHERKMGLKRLLTLIVFILASIPSAATFAEMPLTLDDAVIDIRLTSNSFAMLDNGSFILAGEDANAAPTDDTIVAVMCCVDLNGCILWRYELGDTNTRNGFYDVSVLENGDVQVMHMVQQKNASPKQYLLRIREGELVFDTELDPSANHVTAVGDEILIQTTVSSSRTEEGYYLYRHALTLFTHDFKEKWSREYEDVFTLTGILPINDGYILYGSIDGQHGDFYQYIARLDTNGHVLWSHRTSNDNARYFDAVEAENGDIIAVGGIYAAGDGSSYPIAQISCYSSTGELRWEKEQHDDEYGILFDAVANVPDGYVAVGVNAVEERNVRVVHYDKNGNVIFAWNEPLNDGFNFVQYIDLQMIHDEVYAIVTADYLPYPEDTNRDRIVYRTTVKNIHYRSPL